MLTLYRHAESTANKKKEIAGKRNVQLSPYGEQTAQLWAEYYAGNYKNAKFLTNTQQRCKQTLQALADTNHGGIEIIPDLQERDFGIYTGKTKQDIISDVVNKYPFRKNQTLSQLLEQDITYKGNLLFESTERLKTRIHRAIAPLLESIHRNNIVIVANTGIIRVIISDILQVSNEYLDRLLIEKVNRPTIPQLARTSFVKSAHTTHLSHFMDIPQKLQKLFTTLRPVE